MILDEEVPIQRVASDLLRMEVLRNYKDQVTMTTTTPQLTRSLSYGRYSIEKYDVILTIENYDAYEQKVQ